MASNDAHEPDSDLPPPGSRWGAGAQSVLPYLTKSLQAKPSAAAEPRSEPVGRMGPARAAYPQRPER
jgi:hypothetical protein